MRNKKAEWPVVVVAFIALVGFLYYLGSVFLAGPVVMNTPPPSWIDPVTGRPRARAAGSGKPQAPPGSGGAGAATSSGQSGP
jgi:hypothetical protein